MFAERGYERAGITDIAEAAGIAHAVIYDHFRSKKELHLEALEIHGRALIKRVARDIETDSARQLLHDTVSAFFEFVEQDPFAWRMLFRDAPADAEIAAVHRQIQVQATAALAALFTRAPEVRLSVELDREQANEMFAEAAKSAVNALAGWWYEHRELPREHLVAVTMDFLWHGLERLGGDRPLRRRSR